LEKKNGLRFETRDQGGGKTVQVVTGIKAAFRWGVLAAVLCAIASPVWADYQAAFGAYMRGDYATALREWKPLAGQGDAKAQFQLGNMYEEGQGVPQDYAEAVKWYHKAADQGDVSAQLNLGFMYEVGRSVAQDYSEAVMWFRKAAEQGGDFAQYKLGNMYEEGKGVRQDYRKAVKWYHKAADQGVAGAQFSLGVAYGKGQGVPQNYQEAVRWYRRAADKGLVDAQFQIGLMYAKGQGVAQDYAEALKWYRKAVDQGNVGAQINLGNMYANGQGVPQDYAEAVKWYRKAADQGGATAQFNLGLMYGKGQGVPQNHTEAYLWFSLSAAQGVEKASNNRDLAARSLTPAQLIRAQERASQWRPKAAPYVSDSAQNSPQITATSKPAATNSTPPVPSRRVIREVQKRLAALGYTPGTADGVMGRKTRTAIKAFQRDAGLIATGEATETLAKLMKTMLASRPELKKPASTPPAAPRQVADLGAFHALIIGNNAYRALPRLRTAVKDAYAVAELLQSRYGFRATTLINATRDDVIQALQKMRNQLTERDNLLIYYAGHGKLDRGSDRGYWLPVDADEESPVNWINNVTITDAVKAIQAKHVMVVADSCYSGTLTRDTRGVEVRVKKSDYISKTHGKKSRTVLASGGLEPVSDSGGSGHSVFAKAFMDALRDNEGVIDGLDVFSYVRKQVRLNADQVPNYANIRYAGHEVGGDFLFARKRE
jgi:uncharacterized protein